jgi:mono/diheme cytochrome c family protein
MRPNHRTRASWRVAVVWTCLTMSLTLAGGGAATAREQAGSDGWQIPEGAAGERNPVPVDSASLARGRRLYGSKCQRCHGVDGRGSGPDADPDHAPSDLTDARRASRNPDGVMFYKIWNGRAKPKMPAMKADISANDVWAVIVYVQTLRLDSPASR